MAAYSGTPLAKKLGIKAGCTLVALGEPAGYRAMLGVLPAGVEFASRITAGTDVAHLFVTRRAELAKGLTMMRKRLGPGAMIWVSWPKKASKVASEVTEETVREVALPLGLVDVKVCAVDEVWSGLKLVVRKELR
jgi:hypothetical protein